LRRSSDLGLSTIIRSRSTKLHDAQKFAEVQRGILRVGRSRLPEVGDLLSNPNLAPSDALVIHNLVAFGLQHCFKTGTQALRHCRNGFELVGSSPGVQRGTSK